MKTITKIALVLMMLITGHAWSQSIFSENFNAVTTPSLPAGWSQQNVDGFTVTSNLSTYNFGANAWVTSNATWGQGDKFVVSTSWYNPVNISNDWLITPAIAVPASGTYFLLWKGKAVDQNFADGYNVKISTTNSMVASFGTTLYSTTGEGGGWTSHAVSLAAYNGQTIYLAWQNNSNDKYLLGIDDIDVKMLPNVDLAVNAITPTALTNPSFGAVATGVTIGGSVTNLGANTVTSFTVKYSDGTSTFTDTETGLSIAAMGTYTFTHNTPFTIPSVGSHPISCWVEISGDADLTNDTGTTVINGISFTPVHNVTMEEATGTWCGWCPRGAVYLDSIGHTYPNSTVCIAVHNGDPMTNATYDAGMGTLVSGYPSMVYERKAVADPSAAFTWYNSLKDDFGFAELTMDMFYNSTTRVCSVVAHVKSAVTLSGNYRLACVFTQNGVTGTASGYNQANYYSGGTTALQGAGHDWQTAANPVPAADMVYDYVALNIMGGFTGQTGSLPGSLVGGTTYDYSFTYTLPSTVNANKTNANILLIDATNEFIWNGAWKSVTPQVGVDEIQSKDLALFVYPNPVSEQLNISLDILQSTPASISITDVVGKQVYSASYGIMTPAQYTLPVDVRELASGTYMVSVTTNKGIITEKFIK